MRPKREAALSARWGNVSHSPLAGEAAWRVADIQWQLEKSDYSTLPSAHEKQA